MALYPLRVGVGTLPTIASSSGATRLQINEKGGELMGLFRTCKCGHIEEEHAMDAPEGEQECLAEDCDCENFEPEDEE